MLPSIFWVVHCIRVWLFLGANFAMVALDISLSRHCTNKFHSTPRERIQLADARLLIRITSYSIGSMVCGDSDVRNVCSLSQICEREIDSACDSRRSNLKPTHFQASARTFLSPPMTAHNVDGEGEGGSSLCSSPELPNSGATTCQDDLPSSPCLFRIHKVGGSHRRRAEHVI